MAIEVPNGTNLAAFRVACKDCSLEQLCLPVGIGAADLEMLDKIVKRRRPIHRGEHLFRIGDSFRCFYAVRSGSIKSYTLVEDGREQVTGFHLPGELIGLDAIAAGRHHCAAKALEVASVCEIPFDHFELLAEKLPSLPRQMLRIMSREIAQEQAQITQLGQKSGEERLAAFLVSLSERFRQRGFSASEFNLSMSRIEIGNYLGLAEETVCRLFTRFEETGVLHVDRKHVQIRDLSLLRQLSSPAQSARRRESTSAS
jgi:CRP/FNR family transcriptional regulator, anaerobic regulatory protein